MSSIYLQPASKHSTYRTRHKKKPKFNLRTVSKSKLARQNMRRTSKVQTNRLFNLKFVQKISQATKKIDKAILQSNDINDCPKSKEEYYEKIIEIIKILKSFQESQTDLKNAKLSKLIEMINKLFLKINNNHLPKPVNQDFMTESSNITQNLATSEEDDTDCYIIDDEGVPESSPPLPESIELFEFKKMLGKGAINCAFKAEYAGQKYVVRFPKMKINNEKHKKECEITEFVSGHKNVSTLAKMYPGFHGMCIFVFKYEGKTTLEDLIKNIKELDSEVPLPSSLTSINMPLKTAGSYFMQCLEGLDYLHKKGVVHLDIKPSNIIVTGGDVIKLIDFDCAEYVPYGETRTTDMSSRGTEFYMAPERKRPSKIYDHRADMYAIGTVFYSNVLPITNNDKLGMVLREKMRSEIYKMLKYDRTDRPFAEASIEQLKPYEMSI